jgi:hypothetical protein
MALAVVLLIGAGLMIRSLSALWKVDPGFRSDNVLTFSLSLSPSMRSGSPQATRVALHELSDQITSSPGIRAVSFSAGAIPLAGEDDLFFWIEGQPKPASQSEMNMALVYRVEPGYLSAMGIPLSRAASSLIKITNDLTPWCMTRSLPANISATQTRLAGELSRTARTRSRSSAWSGT